jgi:hypothetical protein
VVYAREVCSLSRIASLEAATGEEIGRKRELGRDENHATRRIAAGSKSQRINGRHRRFSWIPPCILMEFLT